MRTLTASQVQIFGVDIAGVIADSIAAAGKVLPAVLVSRAARPRSTYTPDEGTRATETRVACRAIRAEEASAGERTAKIALLAGTIVVGSARGVPEAGDVIEILGEAWSVDGVSGDGATAVYECLCSRAGAGQR